MAVATRSTNAVKVCLGILGEVEVDDDVYRLDVDTTSEQIRTDQVAANAIAEIVEDTVSGLLGHLGMTVKTGVAQLSNLLGEQLNAIGRVAEDDGLVDLELAE